ncbi:MAG: maleate cis-trans isomerase [Deltaproteobacteria bacterium]|nr:maleate cis-trans isomerase [Deltaproteobacteria bacterium]
MYGERARIGLIVPASNTVCEPEYVKLSPEGVAVYASRVLFEPTIEGLRTMKDHVDRAAGELASEEISDIIVFCCTVGSMMGGPNADREMAAFIEDATGSPAITTTTAVRAAMHALGLRRIAVATPYTREINALERGLLEAMGYEVTDMRGVHEDVAPGDLRNDMIGRLGPESALRAALEVDGEDNRGIFISCTNFRAIEIIEDLERETGKPVVTSNQAGMWYSLRSLGLTEPVSGYGRLLEL